MLFLFEQICLASGHRFKWFNDSNWSLDLRNMSLMPPGFETGSPWQIRISTWSDTFCRKVKSWQVDINVTQCHTSTVGHMANKEHGPGHCSLSKHNTKIFKIAGSFMLIFVTSIWAGHMPPLFLSLDALHPCHIGDVLGPPHVSLVAVWASLPSRQERTTSPSSSRRRVPAWDVWWTLHCFHCGLNTELGWLLVFSDEYNAHHLGIARVKTWCTKKKLLNIRQKIHLGATPAQNTVPCLIQSLWQLPWHTTGNIFPISENPASLSS